MHFNHITESAAFAKEEGLDTECLVMNLKFQNASWEEVLWLWNIAKKEFYMDLKEKFFLSFLVGDLSRDQNISVKKMENFEPPKCEEGLISYDGIFRDPQFGKIRSYSGAAKYIFDVLERDENFDDIGEWMQYRIADRTEFESDAEYLKAYRKMISKEDIIVKSSVILPEIRFGFDYYRRGSKYYGSIRWGISGYLLKYEYTEMLEELYQVFKNISSHIQESIGNIYVAPQRIEFESLPFGMELINAIRDKYDELPYNLFLLGGSEWLNYIPNCLVTEHEISKTGDDRVIVQRDVNGYYFIINRPIREVSIEDKRYIRRKYIDPFLMKAEEYISEGAFRLFGEKMPIFEEELHVENCVGSNGETECKIKFVPMDFMK